MGHWNDTYQSDEVHVDGFNSIASVFTAIHDSGLYSIGKLCISVDSENGSCKISLAMTPQQMLILSDFLKRQAARLEGFRKELPNIAY